MVKNQIFSTQCSVPCSFRGRSFCSLGSNVLYLCDRFQWACLIKLNFNFISRIICPWACQNNFGRTVLRYGSLTFKGSALLVILAWDQKFVDPLDPKYILLRATSSPKVGREKRSRVMQSVCIVVYILLAALVSKSCFLLPVKSFFVPFSVLHKLDQMCGSHQSIWGLVICFTGHWTRPCTCTGGKKHRNCWKTNKNEPIFLHNNCVRDVFVHEYAKLSAKNFTLQNTEGPQKGPQLTLEKKKSFAFSPLFAFIIL